MPHQSFLAVSKMSTKHHQTNSMTLQFLREWGRDLLCGQIGQIRQKANCQHGFQSLFWVNEIFLEAIELKKHNPWKHLKMPNKRTKKTELRHRIIKVWTAGKNWIIVADKNRSTVCYDISNPHTITVVTKLFFISFFINLLLHKLMYCLFCHFT